jgi:hypothetical protein
MKKNILLIFTVLFFAGLFSSCKKDKDPAEKFSTQTVEENKGLVEDAGIEFVNTMDDMKSIESVDVIMSLEDVMSSAGSKKSLLLKDSKILSTLETFTATAKGKNKINELFDAMTSPKELQEDPETIQEFWDQNVGTYTWNPELSDWDIVEGGDKIIFLFPSSEDALTNDASLTIYNYHGIEISNPLEDDYDGDLPVSLNADLKVGTKTLVTYTFAASYNEDGVPNAVASDLTIENYKFEIDIINNTKEVSVNYKFLADNKVIMDLGASGKGLFTQANYDDNTNTVTHTETYGYWNYEYNPLTGQYDKAVWVEYTDTWDETEVEFEEILNSAKAHFQLFNIAIRGDIDVKGLMDQMRLIDADAENEVIDDEVEANRRAEQINKFMNLRLVNVTTNEILAKTEAYVVKDISEYYTDIYVDLRLTFNDGSPIDVQTYFDDGFDNFVDEMNGLISDINSEYDLEIEPIEYK